MRDSTSPSSARARTISNSVASARAVIRRCESRLDTSRLQVLRAEAVVRRIRVYLEGYGERYDSAPAHPLSAENGNRRAR